MLYKILKKYDIIEPLCKINKSFNLGLESYNALNHSEGFGYNPNIFKTTIFYRRY